MSIIRSLWSFEGLSSDLDSLTNGLIQVCKHHKTDGQPEALSLLWSNLWRYLWSSLPYSIHHGNHKGQSNFINKKWSLPLYGRVAKLWKKMWNQNYCSPVFETTIYNILSKLPYFKFLSRVTIILLPVFLKIFYLSILEIVNTSRGKGRGRGTEPQADPSSVRRLTWG